MNGNMRLFLELVANSAGLRREMTSSQTAVTRFARSARGEMDALKRTVNSVSGRLASLGISIGAAKAMMDSARLDKTLTQIGQTAGEGAGKVAQLRQDLFRLGKESGQDVESLKEGFNTLVQSGLNMGEAKATLDGINVAMAVTGSRAETLAGGLTVAATAFQFDLSKPGQALELLDKMTVAGRLGNAELENLSQIFARVGVNAQSAGMGFDKTLGFIEALSMVERQPERLATLADSTLRVFTNLRYMAEAQKATGIKFFDDKGGRRDPVAVLADLKKRYDALTTDKQRAFFIQGAFGKADLDTIKGIKTLLQGESLNKIRQFSDQIGSSGGTLKNDFAEATSNLVDQAGRLKNTLREAADGFVQPINATLADLIRWGMDSKANGGLALDGKDMILGGGGLALGTILAARYGSKSIGTIANKMLGAGNLAVGVAEGKALQAAAGVTPVFVTNWPGTFGAGPGAPVLSPTSRTGIGAAAARWGLPGAVLAAPFVSEWIGNTARENGWNSRTIQRRDREYQVMGIGAPKNDITLNVRIDGNGRVFTDGNDLNTRSRINLQRGDFLPSH